MTTDFSKFQTIIDQFRGQVSASNFDAKFSAATQLIPKTEKFLLKMELKRRASPCNRLIDLRGLVDAQCQFFEHEGRVHFFDELALQVFQENIKSYGRYTFGVYDAVNQTKNNCRVVDDTKENNAAVTGSQVKAVFQKLNYPAKIHRLGQYYNRQEERMNFVTRLIFISEDKQVIDAKTSDLSVHGCKFKINSETKIKVGQRIYLRFIGLENEFTFAEDFKLMYQVCNIYHHNASQFIGVERLHQQVDDSFSQFLTDFIQRNKRRYKINVDNTINAISTRVLEQFVLPKLNELPVFIEQSERGLLPRYALTTHNNQGVFQYWQDENKRSTLHCLMKKQRIDYLASTDLQSKTQSKTLLVFSFLHHNNGKCFFYTADEQELKTDAELGRKFLGFAASKSSFAVTQLHYSAVTPADAESPFTVANTLAESAASFNLPLSEDVSSLFDSLTGIIVANDITHEQLISDYQRLVFEPLDKSLLKIFGHKRLKQHSVVDSIGINYNEQRKEPRFKYKTTISVERQGTHLAGISKNFSTSGINIDLDSPTRLKKGDIVYVSLVSLQKITSEFDLRQLPYEVIQVDKKRTTISLKVYIKEHQHLGRTFFKLLIDKNKDKLTPDQYIQLIPGLSTALRNTYVNTFLNLALIIQTSGSRYKVESITSSTEETQLLTQMRQLNDQPDYVNLYPLLNNLQVSNLLYGGLQKMHINDQPLTDFLYIAINEDITNLASTVTTKLASELGSLAIKEMFISWALKHGRFFCIQTKLSRTNEPDMKYLDPELSYISSFYIHKGKKIEQNMSSVSGVVQLIDVTKETLFRHQILFINK